MTMENVVTAQTSPFFSTSYFLELYAIWWMAWTMWLKTSWLQLKIMWPNTIWPWPTTTMNFGHGVVVDDINIMVFGRLVHGIQIFHLIFS